MDTKALLDSVDLGVVVIAADWTIAQWSTAAARITGLPPERVVGRNFWVAFPSAKGTHIERVLADVLDWCTRWMRSRSTRPLEAVPWRVTAGAAEGWLPRTVLVHGKLIYRPATQRLGGAVLLSRR